MDENRKRTEKTEEFTRQKLRRYRVQQKSPKTNLEHCHEKYNQTRFEPLKSKKDRWKFINYIRKPIKVTDIKIPKNSFGDAIRHPCKIANNKLATLGDFSSLNRYRHEGQMKPLPIASIRNRFVFRYITSKELLDTLRHLNGNKPLGPSQVLGWILQDAVPYILIPLCFNISNAIETQKFLSDLWGKTKSSPFSKMVKKLTLLTTDSYP